MARILRQVTVVRDGMHNGFTDLQHWQGCYWVSYRKGAAHTSMDGEAVVSVSADRARFREVARLHVPGDNRDPKLLPVDENRIALYFPSWVRGVAPRDLQQYISFSGNGYDWTAPTPILEPRMWLWRVRRHEGRYYGLIQNLSGSWDSDVKPHKLDLAVSDDLLEWRVVATIGEGHGLCESDIHWHADGEAWIVARSVVKREGSFFCSARAPYTDWQVTELGPMVHAPIFIEREGRLYVAGRSMPSVEGDETFPFPSASLGVWRVERGALQPVLRIPATGDCSYPGMIVDPDGRVCLSYYSQHAYHMGVVACGDPAAVPDDVYFAELEL
jgi:hypothetical protein